MGKSGHDSKYRTMKGLLTYSRLHLARQSGLVLHCLRTCARPHLAECIPHQMHPRMTKEIVDSLLQAVAISSCVDKVRRRARSSTRLGHIMLSYLCIPSE